MKQKRVVIYSMLLLGVVLCIVCVVIMRYIAEMKYVHVVFLNVGQGDAILIMHGDHQVLVDGGADGIVLQEELGKYMPFWDRTIDIVVATHPDSDHIDGLISIFKNYTVHQFWHTESGKETSQYAALQNAVRSENGVQDFIARHGLSAYIAESVRVNVIYPFGRNDAKYHEDVNEDSIAMIVTVGEDQFYLGGDLPTAYEDQLPINKVSVLKASHHGSLTSTSEFFLNKLQPRDVVFSVGKDNRYGHPHQEVLDRVLKFVDDESRVFRTDVNGSIDYRCTFDGGCMIYKK